MAKKLPRPGNLMRVTKTLRNAALRVCAVLELLGTAGATKLREQIHAQLATTTEAVNKAKAVKVAVKTAKKLTAHTDSGFVAGLKGLLALIEVADAKLFAKLPSVANLSRIDPDGYASTLVTELRSHGKSAGVIADLIQSAIDERLEKKKEYDTAVMNEVHLNKGQASVADLKSLLNEAESLINNSVEPGSPLLDMLKPPRKATKKKTTTTTPTADSKQTPAPLKAVQVASPAPQTSSSSAPAPAKNTVQQRPAPAGAATQPSNATPVANASGTTSASSAAKPAVAAASGNGATGTQTMG